MYRFLPFLPFLFWNRSLRSSNGFKAWRAGQQQTSPSLKARLINEQSFSLLSLFDVFVDLNRSMSYAAL